jgi:aminoglycoside phosphotransferase (APT) family kinase protein
MRFEGDTCTALIDWKTAGVGQPGVDLGSLRLHAALQYGADATAHVLAGWEDQAGHAAADVAYWDAVAALNTHADMEDWTGLDDEGNPARPSLGRERRDAFLRSAVDELARVVRRQH